MSIERSAEMKEWVKEIKEKMEARKKAIADGTLIIKENGNTEKPQ
jgi:hypothetical protein